MRTVGQFEQADVGDDAEAGALDQRQQAGEQEPGQGSAQEMTHAVGQDELPGLIGQQSGGAGHDQIGDAGDRSRLHQMGARAHAPQQQHRRGQPGHFLKEVLHAGAQNHRHGHGQADRHEQSELRIVGQGQHQDRHRERQKLRVPGGLAEEDAHNERGQHQGADAGDRRRTLGQAHLKVRRT